jgi:hypothetical protein
MAALIGGSGLREQEFELQAAEPPHLGGAIVISDVRELGHDAD